MVSNKRGECNMLDALKSLFENDALSEDVRAELQEAWEAKVTRENRKVK